MLKLISFILNLGNRIADHHLSAYAAQAAFFTVLSFFPFLMALISMVRFLPITIEDITRLIISVIPEGFENYIEPLISETLSGANGAVVSLSILFTIWSASKGIMSLKNGLNTITGIRKSNNYFVVRLISSLYTFIFALTLILLLILMVFGNRIIHTLMKTSSIFSDIAVFFSSFRIFIIMCVLLLFFLLLYRALPDEKDTLLHCIPGALISSVGWVGISFLFSIYIDNFHNFTVMYGSLTGIILTLLWLYFCMYIVFIGGELNHYLFTAKQAEKKTYLPL